MGLPQTPNPPHLYPQALQLKLYQAFIFSVPILFSIILLLLFYLFYLKRRRDSNLSPPATLPRRFNHPTPLVSLPYDVGLKEDLKEKLPIIMFDEDLRARDSQCCVCLGEFEVKEQLHQIPACKHVFHIECIHYWLHANTTCPLCRCSVIPTRKPNSEPPVQFNSFWPNDANSDQNPHHGSPEHVVGMVSNEVQSTQIEGSSSGRTCLTDDSSDSQPTSVPMDNGMDFSRQNSVIIQIQMHNS